MLKFTLKRILEAIPTLWVIVTVTFFMIRLVPGGPFDREKEIQPEILEQLESHYGLNDPLLTQYGRYLLNLIQGDLGPSFKYPGWTVNELLFSKLPVSLELGFWSMLVALSIGISFGVLASWRPNTFSDYIPMSLAMLGICLPTFVLGPLLALGFALEWEVFNVMGWNLPSDRVLPSLTLGIFYSAYIARLTRGSMIEIRSLDYIRTAHAKGLSPLRVSLVHGLRNALTPVVSFLGPAFAGLISGSFVVETLFGVPGLGRFFVYAALDSDYTMILGTVLFYALLIILFNFLADLLLVWLNPKQKLA